MVPGVTMRACLGSNWARAAGVARSDQVNRGRPLTWRRNTATLVPQRQHLSGHDRIPTREYCQPAEQSDRDQVQEPQTHGR
jgi:hypothetical protein